MEGRFIIEICSLFEEIEFIRGFGKRLRPKSCIGKFWRKRRPAYLALREEHTMAEIKYEIEKELDVLSTSAKG